MKFLWSFCVTTTTTTSSSSSATITATASSEVCVCFGRQKGCTKHSEVLDIRVRREYQFHGTSLKFLRTWKGITDVFFIMWVSTQFYRIRSLHPSRHPVTASTLRNTEKETCCIRVNHLYRYG